MHLFLLKNNWKISKKQVLFDDAGAELVAAGAKLTGAHAKLEETGAETSKVGSKTMNLGANTNLLTYKK